VRFHLKQYASEAVVFDTASGDTHYLAPLALALFKLCRGHVRPSRDDIVRLLAEYDAIDSGSFSDAQVDETLDGLRKLELIGRQ
jgi:PqqD family protein of HPr-rel-A system